MNVVSKHPLLCKADIYETSLVVIFGTIYYHRNYFKRDDLDSYT